MPDIRAVRDMLRDGYGVEDIAVRLGEPVEAIRAMMRAWQESGAIWTILGKRMAGAGWDPCAGLEANSAINKKDNAE